jgi:hypothetical protein
MSVMIKNLSTSTDLAVTAPTINASKAYVNMDTPMAVSVPLGMDSDGLAKSPLTIFEEKKEKKRRTIVTVGASHNSSYSRKENGKNFGKTNIFGPHRIEI